MHVSNTVLQQLVSNGRASQGSAAFNAGGELLRDSTSIKRSHHFQHETRRRDAGQTGSTLREAMA